MRRGVGFALLISCAGACGARTELGVIVAEEQDGSLQDVAADVGVDALGDVFNGPCPPLDYVNDTSSSVAIAIDDTDIYWVTDAPALVGSAKDHSTSFTTSLGSAPFDGDIVVDDTFVYWTSTGAMKRMPKHGGLIDDLGCAALNGCPGNVQVKVATATAIVLVDGVQPVSFPKQGGSPIALASATIAPPAPIHYVFTDTENVYWNTDIRVFGAPLDAGGAPIQYATSSHGLAIDTLHVYWTAIIGPSTWTLLRADKDGGGVQAMLTTSDTGSPLVANDAFVYGVSSDGGITRQPTSGGAVTKLASNAQTPLTLLLDANCVYFAERTQNGRRVARAPN